MRVSPCIQICDLEDGICAGCHRSTQQIMEWRDYSMDDRMEIMRRIQEQHPRSYCPRCGAPNKCSVELGKSASTCWCMSVDVEYNPDVQQESCMCKSCLTKEVNQ